jgi:hypothetical protein
MTARAPKPRARGVYYSACDFTLTKGEGFHSAKRSRVESWLAEHGCSRCVIRRVTVTDAKTRKGK